MFCPHCAAKNDFDQNYCRSCGLKLDVISKTVAEQFPSVEYAALQKRKELMEKLGVVSFSMAALIGAAFIFSKIVEYKLVLLGAEVMYWSAFIVLIIFGVLSVFFFNYPKLFMNFDALNPRLNPPIDDSSDPVPTTSKLIDDRPFTPASVTENTTRSLKVEERIRR
jgi:amino acid transporter